MWCAAHAADLHRSHVQVSFGPFFSDTEFPETFDHIQCSDYSRKLRSCSYTDKLQRQCEASCATSEIAVYRSPYVRDIGGHMWVWAFDSVAMGDSGATGVVGGEKRAEIYTHESRDPVYAMNWSVSPYSQVIASSHLIYVCILLDVRFACYEMRSDAVRSHTQILASCDATNFALCHPRALSPLSTSCHSVSVPHTNKHVHRVMLYACSALEHHFLNLRVLHCHFAILPIQVSLPK